MTDQARNTSETKQRQSGLTYQGKPRTHGFRLSWTDVFVIILGVTAGILGYSYVGEVALFIPYVVAHFFLFCNIFRVSRKPEVLWAILFLTNCGVWILSKGVDVYGICGSQLLVTVGVILMEIRRPYYHGILARRLNPRLDEHLEGRV